MILLKPRKAEFKTEFARGPGRSDTCNLSYLDETLPDWRDYQTTLKAKVGRLCELDYPPWFFAPNPENCMKISIKFRLRSWLQTTRNFIAISH